MTNTPTDSYRDAARQALGDMAEMATTRLLLRNHNPEKVTAESHPELHQHISDIAGKAGRPMAEKIFLADLDRYGASFAVNTGLLIISRDVLEKDYSPETGFNDRGTALLTHEFGHGTKRQQQAQNSQLALYAAAGLTMAVTAGYAILSFVTQQGPELSTIATGVALAEGQVLLGQALSRWRELDASKFAAETMGTPTPMMEVLKTTDPEWEQRPAWKNAVRNVAGSRPSRKAEIEALDPDKQNWVDRIKNSISGQRER